MSKLHHGQVVWFSEARGYGFIREDEGGKEIFVHYSGIVSNADRKNLYEQQRVEYEVGQNEKGSFAFNVRVST